jgi:cell fate regulator YaaT (PSP1 superfamily)
MGCSTCTSGDPGIATGCKNNGGCQTGGCNKLNVFDWLSDMELQARELFDIVEVRFKGGRKDFFQNTTKLDIVTGDAVIVDVPNGHHLGFVSLSGELVRLQMLKKNIANDENVRQIYRKASIKDLEKYETVKNREISTMYRAREIINQQDLAMKLSDVEFQADNMKATFYYSADERVDFRELIKSLAAEFKIRIEMRQISLRQEAGRLGGIGSCGRELCCSTWLSEFKAVSTSAARYQNLSLNPTKLSGQCGRLKCCLNYELETYMDALKDIPSLEKPLLTEKGPASLQKTDIFRKIMWFGYEGENSWHPIDTSRVKEIVELNKQGKKPSSLQEDKDSKIQIAQAITSDLERLDKKYQGKSKRRKKRKSGRNRRGRNNNNKS